MCTHCIFLNTVRFFSQKTWRPELNISQKIWQSFDNSLQVIPLIMLKPVGQICNVFNSQTSMSGACILGMLGKRRLPIRILTMKSEKELKLSLLIIPLLPTNIEASSAICVSALEKLQLLPLIRELLVGARSVVSACAAGCGMHHILRQGKAVGLTLPS